ncbi:MAG: hypothetical protein P4L33_20745 [Capsulimonadaceae bacterium]|nr:hypothetical protein [Capsulimonadaceae bacterium]
MAVNESSSTRTVPIASQRAAAGFVAPVVGRTVVKDVAGYYGFPLIQKGETITEAIYARAQYMARLHELIAAAGNE